VAFVDAVAGSPENGSRPLVAQTVTYRRTPANESSVEVTVSFEVHESVQELCVNVRGTEVQTVEREHVNYYPEEYDCEYRWDTLPESGEVGEPSVTFRVPSVRRDDGYEFVERDDWALVRASVESTYRTDYANRPSPVENASDPRTTYSESFLRSGVASDGILYFGAASVESWRADGETVRVVVPSHATVDVPAVRETIAGAATNVTIGDRNGTATLFAATDPIRGGGVALWTDDAWVHEDAEPGGPQNVWVHEYVHTRQDWVLGERVAWLTEGSAEYYAALASYRQGTLSFRGFHDHTTIEYGSDVVLANPNAPNWETAQYTKGSRVLAALDRKIRLATDGNRTLADVLYLVNRHDDEVTYDEFLGMVDRVAGVSFEPWLDRHVTTGAAPGVAYDESWVSPPPSDRDADGDGANASVEKRHWLDPFDADSDGDGLEDGREVTGPSDPLANDSDGDGLDDGEEVALGTSPVTSDTDGDGVSDRGEVAFAGTDPTAADTDGDGLDDGTERYDSSLNATVADTDADGLDDGEELDAGTDPDGPDTDGDGLEDGREAELGTDPLAADTDGDGVSDAEELDAGTDPTAADTDGDGLADAEEVAGETDPLVADSDGDGTVDGEDARPMRAGTTTASAAAGEETSADGPTPGFGVATAVLAVLALAAAARRRTP
jgi:hypothetical protein